MKKALSLVLAFAMALSLGAVAFAYNSNLFEDEPDHIAIADVEQDTLIWFTKDSDGNDDGYFVGYDEDEVPASFGKTYYFLVVDKDGMEIIPAWQNMKSASGVKVTPKWDEGEEYIESVQLVRKRAFGMDFWMIELVTKGSSVDAVDVSGKIYLKGSTGTGDEKEKLDKYFNVDLTLEYPEMDPLIEEKNAIIPELPTDMRFADAYLYDFEDITKDDYTLKFGKFDADDDVDYLKDVDVEIDTDISTTKKIVLGYNRDEIDAVVKAYPAADLEFRNLTGTLKKSGEVTLYADEGTFLYKYEDGKLAKVEAEYDEFDEAFVFTAKKLGSYVISNVELDTSALNTATVAPADGTNPSTGAAL